MRRQRRLCRPQATPGGYPNSHLDAFIWVKPPGESDGSSTAVPTGPDNPDGKGFDRMCDPTYAPSSWNGKLTGALPNAPVSGRWFAAQFVQLVQNAYPALGSNPGTPTPPVTPSGSVRPSVTPTIGPSVTPTPTPIRTASPTPIVSTGPGTCSASWHLDNNWGSGFQATVTVTAGSSAITAWRVNWTWPGSQSIVNYWNAAVTSSGGAVTANNLGYNGSLGAGGSTSFGLQVNGSAVTPALSCAANGGPIITPTPLITPSPTPIRTATPTPIRTATPTPSITPSATPIRTASPTPITSTGRTCSASFHVDNSWGSGFQGSVTVTAGSSAISGWRVTWTWPSGQSIVNYWNAAVTSSGSSVTATNLSYNGSIAAGGNTTFGLQLNGSAVTPTLTCTAS